MRVIKATNAPLFATLVIAIIAGRCAANFYVCRSAVLPACTDYISKVCDEARNRQGPNQCDFNGDCAGNRSCSYFGYCEGEADIHYVDCPAGKQCKQDSLNACSDNQSRICDESLNKLGANRCKQNDDCFSGRTCSFAGYCQGTADVELIDCSAIRRLQADETTVDCSTYVNSLSNFLVETGVSASTKDAIIADVNNESTTLEVSPEDNELTDTFANLSDADYNTHYARLGAIIASVPSNKCHALEVELTKINTYLANSRLISTSNVAEQAETQQVEETQDKPADVAAVEVQEEVKPVEETTTEEQTQPVVTEEPVQSVVAEEPVQQEQTVSEQTNDPAESQTSETQPEVVVTEEVKPVVEQNEVPTEVTPEETESTESEPDVEIDQTPVVVTAAPEEQKTETVENPEGLTAQDAKDLEVLISESDLNDPEIPSDIKQAEQEILEFAEQKNQPVTQGEASTQTPAQETTAVEEEQVQQAEEPVVTSTEETSPVDEVTVTAVPPTEETENQEVTEQESEEPVAQDEEPVVQTEEQTVEQAAEEKPAEEQVTVAPEEQPTEDQTVVAAAAEQPAEEQTTEQPSEEPVAEQTTEEQTVEQTTEEQTAEEPTEEKPAEEQTVVVATEEQPAEEETTTEQPVEQQTSEEVTQTEQPEETQVVAVESPAEESNAEEVTPIQTEEQVPVAVEGSEETTATDENEAYKLVLAAMQASPDAPQETGLLNIKPLFETSQEPTTVEATEGEVTEGESPVQETPVPTTSEVNPKLNNAVQQLLSLSDEFAGKFKAIGGSDGKTINELIDEFTVDLFTDEELKVDGVPAEWNVQKVGVAKVDEEVEQINKEVEAIEEIAQTPEANVQVEEQQPATQETEPVQTEETVVVNATPAEEEVVVSSEEQPVEEQTAVQQEETISTEEQQAEQEPIAVEEPAVTEESTSNEEQPAVTEESPSNEEQPAVTEESTSNEEQPVSEETAPVEKQETIVVTQPVSVEEQSAVNAETAPVEEQVASDEEISPAEELTTVEETTPAEELNAAVEESAPTVEEQNAIVEAVVPNVEETAPVQEEQAAVEQPVAVEGQEVPASNEQPVNEESTPVQEQPASNENAPTEGESLTTVVTSESNATENAPVQASEGTEQETSEAGLRMLTILKLYKEHINYRDSDHIVDHRHYGHLRDFHRHLSCLIDNSCDFSKHLHLLESEYQDRAAQQARHLQAAQTTEERGFFGKVWCGIRKFFRRPCPEPEVQTVAVQATVASPAHLETQPENRGWFGRTWCGIRKFFRRPCPEPVAEPVVVQPTVTVSTQAHLFGDEEDTGFFTFMTSRKLAHYLNSAEKHLLAHKEQDQGDNTEVEQAVVASEEQPVEEQVAEEATQEPENTEVVEAAPVENTEEGVSAESSEEQPATVESAEEQPATVESAEEQPATVESAEEQPVTVESAEEQPVTVESAEEQPVAVESNEEQPAAVEVTETAPVDTNVDAFRLTIQSLIEQLPECISNEDIKEASHGFIEKAHEWLTQADQSFPRVSSDIARSVDITKAAAEFGINLTPQQLKAIVDSLHNNILNQLNQTFSSDSFGQNVQKLESLRNSFSQLSNALRSYLPLDSVLQKDLEELVDKLDKQAKVYSEAKDASEEDITAAREYLAKNVDAEFNGIDTNAATDKIKSIMASIKDVANGNLGKSLNEENLNFIVHRVVQAFHADLERTKDPSKPSEFVIDTDDLDLLVDNIVDELKKSREDNQKVIIDLRDFHRWVQAENKRLDIDVNTGNKALDAAEYLIKYENAIYDALGSPEFGQQLKNYVSKYYNVLKAHTKPWSPLVVYSQAYKALTKDISEVSPFPQGEVINRRALHMMRSAIGSQIRHMDKLSQEDRKFFQFFNSLLAEWAQSKDEKAFARKLDQVIRSLQGRQTGLRNLTLVKAAPSHKIIDQITQFKQSVSGIVDNLGTTYDNVIKLSDTIGQGQTLAQQAQDFFSLKNPILTGNTQQATGFFGKIKSWFGGRRLEKHYGITETFESLKNLYNQLDSAHKTAEELKKNVETAKTFANGVKDVFNAVGGIVA